MEVRGIDALSEREAEVVKASMFGLDTPAIAKALFIGEGTVKSHYRNIANKTGSNSRPQLAVALYRLILQEAIAKEIRETIKLIAEDVSDETRAILEELATSVEQGEIDPLGEEFKEAA